MDINYPQGHSSHHLCHKQQYQRVTSLPKMLTSEGGGLSAPKSQCFNRSGLGIDFNRFLQMWQKKDHWQI